MARADGHPHLSPSGNPPRPRVRRTGPTNRSDRSPFRGWQADSIVPANQAGPKAPTRHRRTRKPHTGPRPRCPRRGSRGTCVTRLDRARGLHRCERPTTLSPRSRQKGPRNHRCRPSGRKRSWPGRPARARRATHPPIGVRPSHGRPSVGVTAQWHPHSRTATAAIRRANVLQTFWAAAANVLQTPDRRNPAKPGETTHAIPHIFGVTCPCSLRFAEHEPIGETGIVALATGDPTVCGRFRGRSAAAVNRQRRAAMRRRRCVPECP